MASDKFVSVLQLLIPLFWFQFLNIFHQDYISPGDCVTWGNATDNNSIYTNLIDIIKTN